MAAGQAIEGFGTNDAIELTGITATASNYSKGILTLTTAGAPVTLDIPGTFATGDFVVTNVSAGTDITVVCFRSGTRIRTMTGNVAIERLGVGELVLVLGPEGNLEPRPIAWIGQRSVDCRRHREPRLVWPVRIRAGTFGRGMPWRDLFLSPDHGVFVDDVLIPVKHLINGGTIQPLPVAEVTYYHIELMEHSVLLAEGLPVESYLDTGDRGSFANGGQAIATRMWEAGGCAPLVVAGLRLDAVRRWINASGSRPRASRAMRWSGSQSGYLAA